MVKFGKFFKLKLQEEWKDECINYTFLKKKIKELKSKEQREAKNLSLENSISKTFSHQTNSSNSEKPLEKIIKSHLGKYIKQFLTHLEDEIKKFFKLYLTLEKEIYKKLNSTLFQQINFEDFYLNEIIEELDHLEKLIKEILNLSNFINLNLTAIRKILKKFDKKFNLQNNPMALYFFREKLNDSSSNLVYILQFKIIDECSAITEKLILELENNYKIKIRNFTQNNESIFLEPLLKEMNLNMISGGLDKIEFEKILNDKFEKIKLKNERIDESNNLIRTNVEFWYMNTLRVEFDMSIIEEYKDKMVEYIQEEKMLDNLINHVDFKIYNKNSNKLNNSKNEKINYTNIWLTLIHTLLFTMNAFIVMPSNPLYLERLNSSPIMTGVIISLTPLAAIISSFFYSDLVNSSYKKSYIISLICLILGNFLYSSAIYFQSIFIMGLGRIFIGLGGARVVNRRYLLEQVPSRLILHYSLIYVVMLSLGMSLGPFIALILFTLPNYTFYLFELNSFTYPGWICLVIWSIFSLILLSIFDDYLIRLGNTLNDIENVLEESKMNTQSLLKNYSEREKCILGIKKMNNSFTVLNLVEKGIETLIKEQEDNFSYISISFFILSLILFSLRVKN